MTYLRNVIPELSRRGDCECALAVGGELAAEFQGLRRITVVEENAPQAAVPRFWWEQSLLPGLLRRASSEVLLSAGNFALRNSPIPQILLSRNALYTSREFHRDLLARREYGLWLDTKIRGRLAHRSVAWADCTIAPSKTFAEELEKWTGRPVRNIPHGFDHSSFVSGGQDFSECLRQKAGWTDGAFRLLCVSHYNYYRNFETLFRAMALLKRRAAIPAVKLMLTCSLRSHATGTGYRTGAAAEIIRKLGIGDCVIELGTIPYDALHLVYSHANAYVTAAYAESFAHPLVEAMSSSLPVIASDLAVHFEMCGAAATYFPAFSAESLAEAIENLMADPMQAAERSRAGLQRSRDFSWSRHVEELLKVAAGLLSRKVKPGRAATQAAATAAS